MLIGQAIAIHEWEFEDGTRGGPIAEANAQDTQQTKAATEELQHAGKSCCCASHVLLLTQYLTFICMSVLSCSKFCVVDMPHICTGIAEQQVTEQADHVRHLKEADGLTKGDALLDAAIAELLQRKELLQQLQ